MLLTPEQMNQKIDQHFAFEAADHVDGVLETLAPNVVHDIVGWPTGASSGREGARPFYETLFADLANGKVKCIKRLYGENFLIDESLWSGTAPGRPFGLEGRRRPLRFRLLHVIEFNGSGEIQTEQVWVDLAAIIKQLPQT